MIAERYWRENPQIGNRITAWCQAIAEEFGIDDETVIRLVATEREFYALTMRGQQASKVDEIAAVTGATVSKAMSVFAAAMDACTERVVKDTHGKIQCYPEGHAKAGEPMVHVAPDWPSRLRAAEATIRTTVGFAATKLEIENHTVVEDFSDVELRKQLADAHKRVIALLDQVGTGAAPATGRGAKDPVSAPRTLVLDDGVYKDAGRAGSGESV